MRVRRGRGDREGKILSRDRGRQELEGQFLLVGWGASWIVYVRADMAQLHVTRVKREFREIVTSDEVTRGRAWAGAHRSGHEI